MRGRILIIDDDQSMADALVSALTRRGFVCEGRADPRAAVEEANRADFDAVVSDLNMPGISGADVCRQVKAAKPDLPVVLITAFGSLDTAVQAIRAGAYDFVTKPLEPEHLALALDRAVTLHRLRSELSTLRERASAAQPGALLGESQAMASLRQAVAHLAPTGATALILGETGSGKEVVAREMHRLGGRTNGPWVAINCAALPDTLLESELFGHAKGAFTDARSARRGLFAQASGGTLFLDEIGDMPIPLQSKVLRALETRTVRPVGGDAEIEFDSRILAATHQDLALAVAEGRFREDLLYRLDVVRIDVPPLRARGNDVLLLGQRFLQEAAERMKRGVSGISGPAASLLLGYSWPGNVRELRNCIERAVATTRYEQIAPGDLPEKVRHPAGPATLPSPRTEDILLPLDEVERQHIYRVLAAVGGNRSAAAEVLCIDRKTLARKLDRWKPEGGAGT